MMHQRPPWLERRATRFHTKFKGANHAKGSYELIMRARDSTSVTNEQGSFELITLGRAQRSAALRVPVPISELFAEGDFLEFADGGPGDFGEEDEGVGELPFRERLT